MSHTQSELIKKVFLLQKSVNRYSTSASASTTASGAAGAAPVATSATAANLSVILCSKRLHKSINNALYRFVRGIRHQALGEPKHTSTIDQSVFIWLQQHLQHCLIPSASESGGGRKVGPAGGWDRLWSLLSESGSGLTLARHCCNYFIMK